MQNRFASTQQSSLYLVEELKLRVSAFNIKFFMHSNKLVTCGHQIRYRKFAKKSKPLIMVEQLKPFRRIYL